MTERSAGSTEPITAQLHREVIDNPRSLEVRQVMADWLDDRGDPRGAFIRAQLALADRSKCPEGQRSRWAEDEQRLYQQYAAQWDRTLQRVALHCDYRQGFVEHVRISLSGLLRHADEIFASAPVRSITLAGNCADVEALHDCPGLQRLEGLRLEGGWLGYAGAVALAGCPHFRNLRYLSVPNNGLGVEAVRRLLDSPYLRNIEGLDLSRNADVGERGVELIRTQRGGGGLKRLLLHRCGASGRIALGLSRWPGLADLRVLDLTGNGLTIAGYDALFSSPFWRRRTRVRLTDREHRMLQAKLGRVYRRAGRVEPRDPWFPPS